VLEELDKHEAKIRDATHWRVEIQGVHEKLVDLEKQQRSSRVEKIELGPEVSIARQHWLAVYNANKLLIRGMLAHLGKNELLPLVFDDLAEVHRASGVTDELPETNTPTTSDG
jgi:hypothetical protein